MIIHLGNLSKDSFPTTVQPPSRLHVFNQRPASAVDAKKRDATDRAASARPEKKKGGETGVEDGRFARLGNPAPAEGKRGDKKKIYMNDEEFQADFDRKVDIQAITGKPATKDKKIDFALVAGSRRSCLWECRAMATEVGKRGMTSLLSASSIGMTSSAVSGVQIKQRNIAHLSNHTLHGVLFAR